MIELNPWDVPNDEFAAQVEDGGIVKWSGVDWQILLFGKPTDEEILLFGKVGSKNRSLVVRRVDLGLSAPIWRITHRINSIILSEEWHPKKSQLTKNELVLAALEEKRVSRRFYTNSKREPRDAKDHARMFFDLNAVGVGGFSEVGYRYMEEEPPRPPRTYFRWPSQTQGILKEMDSMKWWTVLQKEWEELDSDASFAFDFYKMTCLQKRDLVWSWKNGSYKAAKRILTLALSAQQELWDKDSRWSWNLKLPLSEVERCSSIQSGTIRIESLELQRAAELVNAHFAPQPDADLIARHLCVRKWRGLKAVQFHIPLVAMTMHEGLEAHLRWRRWSEKHGG